MKALFVGILLGAVGWSGLLSDRAEAASVSLDSVQGLWTVTTPTSVHNLTGLGTSQINWGKPFYQGQTQNSGYGFAGTAGLPTDVETDTDFVLGRMTHYNYAISNLAGTGITAAPWITSATLSLTINASVVDENGQTQQRTLNTSFVFSHDETRNFAPGGVVDSSATCANGGQNGSGINLFGCADRVQFSIADLSDLEFTVGYQTFMLQITGFNPGPFFWTIENFTNVTDLWARFVLVRDDTPPPPPPPVPLPAAGWLLIAGLGGMYALRRKRS